jgi:hypothetical protein
VNQTLGRTERLKLQIQKQEAELRRVMMLKTKLYEERCAGIIVEDDYASMMEKYSDSIKELEATKEKLVNSLTGCIEEREKENSVEKVFQKYLKKRKLSKAMVDAFIESIVVHNDGTMEVLFKLKDEYEGMHQNMLLRKGEEVRNAV